MVNITDIDEKVFKRAKELGTSYKELAEKYTKEFINDMASLDIDTVTTYAKASDYVYQAINQVEVLLKKGFAYRADGDVYFDTSRFVSYGALSHQSPLELKLRRVDLDPRKRDQTDFLLWKKSEEGEPSWQSPMGVGRPRWHIEDTAISITLFGPSYDIYGGAKELIFPHHDAEIAQAEAFTGESPFVKYWIHTGMLLDKDGKKMSKSRGNTISVKEAVTRFGARAIRLYFLKKHYRRSVKFCEYEVLKAKTDLSLIQEAATKAKESVKNGGESNLRRLRSEFLRIMDDDLNTPRALNVLLKWAEEILQNSSLDLSKPFLEMARIFGLLV